MHSQEEQDAARALKAIARNLALKEYVQGAPELFTALWPAARRFVAGATREEGLQVAELLAAHGYGVSLEYIGENTSSEQECRAAVEEFVALSRAIDAMGLRGATISLDLSHIGLSVSKELALASLQRLAEQTGPRGQGIMISMEESEKGPAILEIYQRVAQQAPHVGITLQAHLYRSEQDLERLLALPGKIRLVKGAYQEPVERALTRGETLDERYLALAGRIAQARHPLSLATHDEQMQRKLSARVHPDSPHVEIEMLYGIRPDLLKQRKAEGYRTRLYLTYGTEWYLYLCHRLAEYPPNIYQALADCVEPSRTAQPAQAYG